MSHSDLTPLEPLIQGCLESLAQEWRQPEVEDPYWPKWDHGWWKLTLLWEMGLLERVPRQDLERFYDVVSEHYLPFFPLREEELPQGCDPYREILCHCALGTLLQIFTAAGLDPWVRWPWLARWLVDYALPDGGYNCDEAAYTGSQKSSVVSTLPMLEALLGLKVPESFEAQRQQLLAKGVEGLLRRKLLLSSQGQVIDPRWLTPIFPRFYEYDLLRGLKLVLEWAARFQQPLSVTDLAPAWERMEHVVAEEAWPQAWYLAQERSLTRGPEGWSFGAPVTLFPLLDAVTLEPKWGRLFLEPIWQRCQERYAGLSEHGLLGVSEL